MRKALVWSYTAQGLIFLLSFGSSIVVARIIGPYEIGIFAAAAAIASIPTILSQFGVGHFVVRHEVATPQVKATAFTVNWVLNLLVGLTIFAVVVVGERFGLPSTIRHVLALIALTPLIAAFEFLPSVMLQREMNFSAVSLINLGRALVNSAVLVGAALLGLSSLSLAVAMIAAALFSAVAYNVVGFQHVRFRLSLHGWRDITRFGLQMMSIGGAGIIAQRLGELVIGRTLGLAALGVYSRAAGLSTQVWENVYGLATRVIFAQMAKELRETNSVEKTFLGGISIITALVWPLMMGIAVLSAPIIQLLYGEAWRGAALPLALLMLMHFVGLGFGMNWELCVLTRRTGWQAKIELSKAVVGFVGVSLGALVSLTAAAAGRIAEALFGLAVYAPRMREMAGTRPGAISTIYVQSALLTCAAVGPSGALMVSTGFSAHTSWRLVIAAIAVGIGAWFVVLRVLRHPLLGEIERLLARLGRSRRAA